jgi:hypothetical protein
VTSRHTGLPFDAIGVPNRSIGRVLRRIDDALVRLWPTMFAYQFVFELELRPASPRPAD